MIQAMVAISFGASCGALLRWGLSQGFNALHPHMPMGTLLANGLGGYLAGVALAVFAAHPDWHPHWRLLVVTGFLGGLTTFSTFSAEVIQLVLQGRHGWAVLTAGAHLLGSLALTALGYWVHAKPTVPAA